MNITYNNLNPEYYGCWLATRPVITPSEVTRDRYLIPGRRGELIGKTETRGNAHITFTIHQKCDTANKKLWWGEAQRWLREAGHNLVLSYDTDYYYEVVNSTINSFEYKDDEYRRMEIDMEVYPYKYKANSTVDGKTITAGNSDTWVMHTDECEPQYSVYLTQSSGTITINSKTINVYSSGQNVNIIDVRRKTATYENCISGLYEDMVLKDGTNTIATSSGVQVTVSKSREGFLI